MAWIIGILIFLIVLGITIGLHEGGHLVAAKKLGLLVPKFFIGMGPTLFSFKTKDTEYGLKALPIGGFVNVVDPKSEKDNSKLTKDERSEQELHQAMLSHVAPWRRIIVFLAGPAVNIVLGLLILTGTFWFSPMKEPVPVIHTVNSCASQEICGAATAGLKPGDQITQVNGQAVSNTDEINPLIVGDEVAITVLRDGVEMTVTVPVVNDTIGINYQINEVSRTFLESVDATFNITGNALASMATIPSKVGHTVEVIFGADRTEDSLASVVTIGSIYGAVSSSTVLDLDDKTTMFFFYAGVINLSLGFVNLLPILPLDGGRIFVALMDSVRGFWARVRRRRYTPVRAPVITSLMIVGTTLVVGCMAIVVLADLISPVDVSGF